MDQAQSEPETQFCYPMFPSSKISMAPAIWMFLMHTSIPITGNEMCIK